MAVIIIDILTWSYTCNCIGMINTKKYPVLVRPAIKHFLEFLQHQHQLKDCLGDFLQPKRSHLLHKNIKQLIFLK